MLIMLPDRYDGMHPNASLDVACSCGGLGRTQPGPDIGTDLRNAREKTATGSLTNTHDVQHMNEGRHGGVPTMFCVARKLTLMSTMLAEFS
jgi:hypothetical protein